MGRPREHTDETKAALLDAAERLIEAGGPDALSVRAAADVADTTTRAVYSLFGSKDGLLVAIATQAFEHLRIGLEAFPTTTDPAADLVELGTRMYRGFVREHPAVFRLAFQRIAPGIVLPPEFFQARTRTWAVLEERLQRLEDASGLGGRTVTEAAVQFNALCEGLANAEVRGGTMAAGDQERIWRAAFQALVAGLSLTAEPAPRSTPRPADDPKVTLAPARRRGKRRARQTPSPARGRRSARAAQKNR